MKIISTEAGQVLQLFVMDEIRPLSGLYLPTLLAALGERYGFVTKPANLGDDLAKGVKFQTGHHVTDGRDISINEITFFNDGVIVIALNTDDAEIVLDDFWAWATQTFKLREDQTKRPRTYVSSVVVEFGSSIDAAIKGFETASKKVSDAINVTYGRKVDTSIFRLSFAADPTTVPPHFNTQFTIERRLGIPFSKNRYFSSAPLKTKAHLGILKELENILVMQ